MKLLKFFPNIIIVSKKKITHTLLWVIFISFLKLVLLNSSKEQQLNFLLNNNIQITQKENEILYKYIKENISIIDNGNVKSLLFNDRLNLNLNLKNKIYQLLIRFI